MMLISYVDNVDNFLLFVENSFENRLKLHISLSIERIKFKDARVSRSFYHQCASTRGFRPFDPGINLIIEHQIRKSLHR